MRLDRVLSTLSIVLPCTVPIVEASAQGRSGFMNMTSIGRGFGMGDYVISAPRFYGEVEEPNDDMYWRFETINGAWLKEGVVSLGLGIGYESYAGSKLGESPASNGSFGQLPLFLDVRLHPGNAPVTVFAMVQAGYSFGINPFELPAVVVTSEMVIPAQSVELNGVQLAPGLGFLFRLSDDVAFHLSCLYDYHRFNYELIGISSVGGYIPETYAVQYGAVRIASGFVF